jgi:PAS domain S-box-containing protein
MEKENLNLENLLKTKEKELEQLKEELERTKEDLEDLEVYVEEFFSFLPFPVCTLNAFGLIINANKAFLRLVQYDLLEIVGQYFNKLFREEKEIEKIIEALPQKEIVENKEATLLTKDKKEIIVNLSFGARKDKEGIFIGSFVGMLDISELKRFQNELEEMVKERTEELEEKIAELEKFRQIAVGRELKMVELKEKVKTLQEELKKYKKQ